VALMIYATVVVTVLSGLDYFFGLRKRLNEAQAAGAAARRSEATGARARGSEAP
jgi:hypothetical protein